MWYDSSEGIKAERDRRLGHQVKRKMLVWSQGTWWCRIKAFVHDMLRGF